MALANCPCTCLPGPAARSLFLPGPRIARSPLPAPRKRQRLLASTGRLRQIPRLHLPPREFPAQSIRSVPACPLARSSWSGRAVAGASRARRHTLRRATAPPQANVRNNPTCSHQNFGAPRCFETPQVRYHALEILRCRLCAFLPRSQILLLLGGQLIQTVPHGLQLQPRDLAIQMPREPRTPEASVPCDASQGIPRIVIGSRSSYPSPSRMPFGRGQVYQAPLGDEINLPPVLQQELVHQRPNFPLARRQR